MDEAPRRHAQPCHDRSPSAEHTDLALCLLRRARSHHGAASALSGEPDIADFVIGFHAHQAVEQSLVAVLVHSGEPPPRTHVLDCIVRLLAERGLIAPRQLTTSGWLNPWAVTARYEDVEPALDRPSALETAMFAIEWAVSLVSPHDACHLSQAAHSDMLPLPSGWDRTLDGEPMPDIVAAVREARAGR
jgi:HEPN domain-containing protein